MVGENDIKCLFIYSIDDINYPVIPLKYELNKGWYRAFCTPWVSFFFFLERGLTYE